MVTPSGEMVAAVATVGAALVSGVVAFLSLLISKEQAVSEFRQRWIDALRDDLSDLLSSATGVSVEAQLDQFVLERDGEFPEMSKRIGSVRQHLLVAYKSYHRAVLRLNPGEHVVLRGHLDRIEAGLSRPDFIGNPKVFGDACADLNAEAHRVLKKEWQLVKRGEAVYVVSKVLSGFIAITLLLSAGTFLVLKWS